MAWGVLFAVIAAFYVTTFSFRRISDTDLNSYQTRALALHGDVDLARYGDRLSTRRSFVIVHDGRRFSPYGVGVSVTTLPIYAIGARAGASDRTLLAAAVIPFVAAGAIVMLSLLLRLFPRVIAVGATTVYAFGTTLWPLASMAFFQHGPASFYQALGLGGLFSRGRRAPALAGIGFSLAAFIRPTLFIPLFIVGALYLIEDRAKAFLYAVGTLPAVLGVLVQNRWIWGSWFAGGYSEAGVGFSGEVPRALQGLLFGWWRGLFVYSPVLILGIVGGVLALKRMNGFVERRMITVGISSVALIFFYSKWSTWFGGQNQFGYRYLLDIVPFLVILGAYGVARSERLRVVAIPLGLLSVMTMAFGAAPNRFGWDFTFFPKDVEHTSLGQSWIVFFDKPLGSVLRLAGVAAIGGLMYVLAPGKRSGSMALGGPAETREAALA